MKSGSPRIGRVHAKNFIHKEADRRLNEMIPQIQAQQVNALGVDSHRALYFRSSASACACTCKKVQSNGTKTSAPETILNPDSSISEVVFDYDRPLFGSPTSDFNMHEESINDDYELMDDDEDTDEHTLFESSIDCGLCYRTGYVPGLEPVGFQRQLYTTFNIEEAVGYTIQKHEAPNSFLKVLEEGFVEFLLTVPKYFNKVDYSIRNNREVLSDNFFVEKEILTLNYLKQKRGSIIKVRIKSKLWTHAFIQFDIGTPIQVNLAQYQKQIDWTKFETLGSLGLVVPHFVGQVNSGDIIVLPERKVVLKITDVPHVQTARGSILDWNVTTRAIQPQESVFNIAKTKKLL